MAPLLQLRQKPSKHFLQGLLLVTKTSIHSSMTVPSSTHISSSTGSKSVAISSTHIRGTHISSSSNSISGSSSQTGTTVSSIMMQCRSSIQGHAQQTHPTAHALRHWKQLHRVHLSDKMFLSHQEAALQMQRGLLHSRMHTAQAISVEIGKLGEAKKAAAKGLSKRDMHSTCCPLQRVLLHSGRSVLKNESKD